MITIKIDDKAVQHMLAELAQRGNNMQPVMRKVAGAMLDAVEENFAAQGRPPWQALKPSTIKSRQRSGHWPGKILQRSGQLAASLSTRSTATEAAVGTNKEYAAIHQFGGTINQGAHSRIFKQNRYVRGKKKGQFKKGTTSGRGSTFGAKSIVIPARPFLAITDNDLESMGKMIADYLVDGNK